MWKEMLPTLCGASGPGAAKPLYDTVYWVPSNVTEPNVWPAWVPVPSVDAGDGVGKVGAVVGQLAQQQHR